MHKEKEKKSLFLDNKKKSNGLLSFFVCLFCLFVCLFLTVRLLVTCTSTGTTELLRLAAARISDKEGSIVGDKLLLDLSLGGLVNELLEVGNDALADGLSDGVDLRDIATTADANTDVNALEDVLAEDEDGLEDLEAKELRLNELNGAPVDADHALALLTDGNGDRSSLWTKKKKGNDKVAKEKR